MSIRSFPVGISDLLIRLRFLSKLNRNQKLNMTNMSFVSSDSWIGTFYRSFYGESRKNTLSHITHIVSEAVAALYEYRETDYVGIITQALSQARVGIQQLIFTYKDDQKIVAEIEVILFNIDRIVAEVSNRKEFIPDRLGFDQHHFKLPQTLEVLK